MINSVVPYLPSTSRNSQLAGSDLDIAQCSGLSGLLAPRPCQFGELRGGRLANISEISKALAFENTQSQAFDMISEYSTKEHKQQLWLTPLLGRQMAQLLRNPDEKLSVKQDLLRALISDKHELILPKEVISSDKERQEFGKILLGSAAEPSLFDALAGNFRLGSGEVLLKSWKVEDRVKALNEAIGASRSLENFVLVLGIPSAVACELIARSLGRLFGNLDYDQEFENRAKFYGIPCDKICLETSSDHFNCLDRGKPRSYRAAVFKEFKAGNYSLLTFSGRVELNQQLQRRLDRDDLKLAGKTLDSYAQLFDLRKLTGSTRHLVIDSLQRIMRQVISGEVKEKDLSLGDDLENLVVASGARESALHQYVLGELINEEARRGRDYNELFKKFGLNEYHFESDSFRISAVQGAQHLFKEQKYAECQAWVTQHSLRISELPIWGSEFTF